MEQAETFPSIRHLMDGREFLHASLSSPFHDIHEKAEPTEPGKKESIQDIMKGRNFEIVPEEMEASAPEKKESIQDIMLGRNFDIGKVTSKRGDTPQRGLMGQNVELLPFGSESLKALHLTRVEYHQLLCQQQQRQLKRRNGKIYSSKKASQMQGKIACKPQAHRISSNQLFGIAQQSKLVW